MLLIKELLELSFSKLVFEQHIFTYKIVCDLEL